MKTLEKQTLFWDVDLKKIDPKEHKNYIIKRILGKGDLDDFRWIIDFYGKNSIKNVFLKNFHQFDLKSSNFWCVNFNIDKDQCIQKQSMKKQSAFLTR